MLQARIPALKNLYEVKFKVKGALQKNDTSNTNAKKIYRAVKPLSYFNINKNAKAPCKRK